MKKILFFLFIVLSLTAFAQQPCTPPVVSVSGIDSICPGELVTLTASVRGSNAPFTYFWSVGATTSTVTVSPSSTTTYSITVTNSCGDSTKATITVAVENPTLSVCCNGTIALGNSATLVAGGNSDSYLWEPAVTCLNPPLCDSVKVTPTVTTTYTVVGTDNLGCSIDETVTIVVGAAGVPSILETDGVTIYPNPSSTSFTIDIQAKAILSVCDITGRVLFSEMENAGTITFGNDLTPGIYFFFIDGKRGGKLVKL